MNILFYQQQFPGFGGIETVTATLAAEFSRRGHQVQILAHQSGNGTSDMTFLPKAVRVDTMPDARHLNSRQNQMFLKRLISECSVDIVVFQDSYASIERNLLGCGTSAKILTVEHSSPFYCITEEHPERFTWSHRAMQILKHFKFHLPYHYEGRRKRFLYDLSARYVLLSNRFYGEFKSMARLFDSRKLRSVWNPVSPCLVPDKVDWGKKENRMVFAGTLAEGKGIKLVLKALQKLKNAHLLPAGWRVDIFGEGPERTWCERFLLDNGLDFVSLCGSVENPQAFFARTKILLFPSQREGFGNVLVEAQANGCVPIAFSSYSSVFDIVHDGEDGILVDAFDIDKYAVAIHSLMVDNAKWRLMAQNAIVAKDRFSLAKIADQWEMLFAEVIGDGQ